MQDHDFDDHGDDGDDMGLMDEAFGGMDPLEATTAEGSSQHSQAEGGGAFSRPSWNQMVCALDDINFADEYSFFNKKLQSSWAGGAGTWKPTQAAGKDEGKKKRGEKVSAQSPCTRGSSALPRFAAPVPSVLRAIARCGQVAMTIDFANVSEMDFGSSFDRPSRQGPTPVPGALTPRAGERSLRHSL